MGMVEDRRGMPTTTDTWHKRIGYTLKGNNFKGYVFKSNNVDFSNKVCDSWVKAKLSRTPFSISYVKSNAILSWFIMTFRVFIEGRPINGKTIFLPLSMITIDLYGVFLIRHKSDASRCLVDFHKMV